MAQTNRTLPEIPIDDRMEFRLALVMSGGVSLAVWMGGATYEIYRFIRSTSERSGYSSCIYRDLADLVAIRPVIDVVSGTSAGGLNGVLLATAVLADLEVKDLLSVRDTWLATGSFEKLLRKKGDESPSLLQGDEVFYVEIEKVLNLLASPRSGPLTDPIDLLITTTLIEGQAMMTTDHTGAPIHEIDHRASFQFTFDAGRRQIDWDTIVPQFALAARSSASYPVAFEASYVPVGATVGTQPDMADPASFDTSRYVLDGGLLNNRPLGLALDAVRRRSAETDVKRVIAFLVPDPRSAPPERSSGGQSEERIPPTLGEVLRAVALTIPFNQSVRDDLLRLQEHNQEATAQRHRREGFRGLDANLRTRLVPQFEKLYTDTHARRSANGIMRHVSALQVKAIEPSSLLEFVTRRLERERSEQLHTRAFGGDGADRRVHIVRQWDPSYQVAQSELPSWADMASLPKLGRDSDQWPWGISALAYATETALDLIRRAMSMMRLPTSSELHVRDAWEELRRIKGQLHGIRQQTLAMETINDLYWQWRLRELTAVDYRPLSSSQARRVISKWVRISFRYWPQLPGDAPDDDLTREMKAAVRHVGVLGDDLRQLGCRGLPTRLAYDLLELLAVQTAALMVQSRPIIAELIGPKSSLRTAVPSEELRNYTKDYRELVATPFNAPGSSGPIVAILERILEMYVVQTALGISVVAEHPAHLVEFSANARSHLDGRSGAEEKLAGLQLGHFGAFLKQSWRANDWMWGRLDSADRIATMLLDPPLLRRRFDAQENPAALATAIVHDIVVVAGADGLADRAEELEHLWARNRGDVEIELQFLDRPFRESDEPTALPRTASVIAQALQLAIIEEELPRIRDSILHATNTEQAAQSDESTYFVDQVETATEDATIRTRTFRRVRSGSAARLLALMRVGSESWTDEAGTDMLTKVASGAALAGTQAVASPQAALGPLGWVARRISDSVTLGYYAARGATHRSHSAAVAVSTLLILASTILGVHILVDGASFPAWIVAPALIVLAALLFAVRGRGWQEVLLWIVLGMLVLAGIVRPEERQDVSVWVVGLLVFVGIAAALVVIGWRPTWPEPLASWFRVSLGIVAAVAILIAIWAALDAAGEAQRFVYDNRVAIAVVIPITMAVIVGLRAHRRSRRPGRNADLPPDSPVTLEELEAIKDCIAGARDGIDAILFVVSEEWPRFEHLSQSLSSQIRALDRHDGAIGLAVDANAVVRATTDNLGPLSADHTSHGGALVAHPLTNAKGKPIAVLVTTLRRSHDGFSNRYIDEATEELARSLESNVPIFR